MPVNLQPQVGRSQIGEVLERINSDRSPVAMSPREELAWQLIASSADCIKVLDLEGNILFLSDGAQSALEMDDVSGLLHTSWFSMWQEADREPARAAAAQAISGQIGHFTAFRKTFRGTSRWWNVLVTPVRRDDGVVTHLLVISRDVTEKHLADTALRESQVRLKLAVEAAEIGTYEWNIGSNQVSWDDRARAHIGVPAGAEMTYDEVQERVHPDDRVRVLQAVERALNGASGGKLHLQCRTLSKVDGAERVIAAIGQVQFSSGVPQRLVGVTMDITARKQAELELRESRNRAQAQAAELQAVMNAAQVAICVSADPDCRNIYGNPRAYELFGVPPGTNLSPHGAEGEAPAYSLFSTDLRQLRPDEMPMVRVCSNGEPVGQQELQVARGDGSRRDVLSNATPMRDPDGSVRGVVAAFLDVTELKKREQELRAALQRLTAHMHNSAVAVIEFDAEMRVIAWSAEAERTFGWTATEVLGRRISDFRWVFEEDAPRVESLSQQMLQGQSLRNVTCNRNYRKDGTVIDCEWYNSTILGEKGQPASILGFVLDVTGRNEAVRKLRASEERFRLATDALNGVIYDWDVRTDKTVRSSGLRDLVGYDPDEVPVDNIWWFKNIHPDDAPAVKARIQNVFSQRAVSMESEYRVRHRDGRWIYVNDRARVVYGPDHHPVRVIGSRIDITARRQFMTELERIVAQRTLSLQQATQQLNAFCYSVAHDLRAPLRTQIGFARALLDDYGAELDEVGRKYARLIVQSAERQSEIIQDLLTHVNITRADLSLEPLRLSEAIQGALADLVLDFQDREAVIDTSMVQEFEVLANRSSLHLVLLNLLTNACKFVAPGVKPRVAVRAERVEHQRSEGPATDRVPPCQMIRITVEDNGIGIAPAHIGKLFGMFKRLHSSDQYPGTGMGLANVKAAAERMGGSVGVESVLGKGSQFWVELKAATPPEV